MRLSQKKGKRIFYACLDDSLKILTLAKKKENGGFVRIEMNADLTRAIMGVSLANRAFSKKFVVRLCKWTQAKKIAKLKVVIFDDIEAINYQVFRGVSRDKAHEISRRRGLEIQRMFLSIFCREELSHECEIESETDIRSCNQYKIILKEFSEALQKDRKFRQDVEAQVLENLKGRTEHYGRTFVLSKVPDLMFYIIGEMVFFEIYHLGNPGSIELYPGKNLMVKERLWAGEYNSLINYRRIGLKHFVDVSFLNHQENDDPYTISF